MRSLPVRLFRGWWKARRPYGPWGPKAELTNTAALLLFSRSVVSNFCEPMDCSPPGSSVHGISQARTLEGVAVSFSDRSSRPRGGTLGLSHISCIGRQVLCHWHHLGSPGNMQLLEKYVNVGRAVFLLDGTGPKRFITEPVTNLVTSMFCFFLSYHKVSGQQAWPWLYLSASKIENRNHVRYFERLEIWYGEFGCRPPKARACPPGDAGDCSHWHRSSWQAPSTITELECLMLLLRQGLPET